MPNRPPPRKLQIAATLLITLLCGAVPSTRALSQDDLSRVVDALQAKYRKLSTLSADFTQVYTASRERNRRESGRLLLKKPGKMRWDYSSPENKLFVSDGKVIYEYVPSEKIATRTKVRESSDLRAPFMFLLGRGDLRRDFRTIEWAQEAPSRAGFKVLRLIPKRTQDFLALFIEIDPTTLQLSRVSFVDSDKGRSDFLLANVRENLPVNDTQFKFEPPAGVRVIE